MVAGGVTGRAAGCDLLPLVHDIADLYQILGVMCVQRRHTVAVIDDNVVAVAVMALGNDNRTAVCSINGSTVSGRNVNTVVELRRTGQRRGSPSEIRGNLFIRKDE